MSIYPNSKLYTHSYIEVRRTDIEGEGRHVTVWAVRDIDTGRHVTVFDRENEARSFVALHNAALDAISPEREAKIEAAIERLADASFAVGQWESEREPGPKPARHLAADEEEAAAKEALLALMRTAAPSSADAVLRSETYFLVEATEKLLSCLAVNLPFAGQQRGYEPISAAARNCNTRFLDYQVARKALDTAKPAGGGEQP